jgi:hypothetical protein
MPTWRPETGHAQIFAGAAASRCSSPAAGQPTVPAQEPYPQTDPLPGTDPCRAPIDLPPETDLRRAPIDPLPETDLRPAPIDRPHGAGQPRSGSRADRPAGADPVWWAEAGALLAASEVEEAVVDAAAEGALILLSNTIFTSSDVSRTVSASIASAIMAATKPMSVSSLRKSRR